MTESARSGETRASRVWLAIALAGLGVGAVSVAFHAAVDGALALREGLTAWAEPFGPAGAVLVIGVCAVSVALALWLTETLRAAGGGQRDPGGRRRAARAAAALAARRSAG